jgi:hypothetical protein
MLQCPAGFTPAVSDGYTLMMCLNPSLVISPSLYRLPGRR